MRVSELIYLLETQDDLEAEVLVNAFEIPGIGQVFGASVDAVGTEDRNVVIEVTAP